MTKKEFSQLSTGLKAAYPRFQLFVTDEEMTFWYMMLQDIDYRVAENAALEHISTNPYPPSIAEIRKLCTDRTQETLLSFDEAWGVVQNAISSYGADKPTEAYSTMDELTLSVVKNLGWTNICHSENTAADRANFRESYLERAKKRQNNMQLPEFVARKKLLIQEQYKPMLEVKEAPQIEQFVPEESREDLTEEQMAKRHEMVENMRRKLFGGETE